MMHLKSLIQDTLAAINRGELAENRMFRLNHEEEILKEQIFNIEEECAYIVELSRSNSLDTLDLDKDYAFLIKKHRTLSEQLGMIVFEKDLLKDKAANISQLKLKLKALLSIRATQLETLPLPLQIKIEKINQQLDAIFVIKGELDRIIQFVYRLKVKFSDIQEAIDTIVFKKYTLFVEPKIIDKAIWEVNHQLKLTYRQSIDFEDNLNQINRLQVREKFSSRLSLSMESLLDKPLLRQDDFRHFFDELTRFDKSLDNLIVGFKKERRWNTNQIKRLEHQRTEILVKK